jgi:hypothetical protein
VTNTLAYEDKELITTVTNFIVQAGANVIKLLTPESYKFSKYAIAFVLGKPFQPSLMLVGKA